MTNYNKSRGIKFNKKGALDTIEMLSRVGYFRFGNTHQVSGIKAVKMSLEVMDLNHLLKEYQEKRNKAVRMLKK